MAIHSLISEHLPAELASIVVNYVVREDWKPIMSEVLKIFDLESTSRIVGVSFQDFLSRDKLWTRSEKIYNQGIYYNTKTHTLHQK